jgi:hypothetical protein
MISLVLMVNGCAVAVTALQASYSTVTVDAHVCTDRTNTHDYIGKMIIFDELSINWHSRTFLE